MLADSHVATRLPAKNLERAGKFYVIANSGHQVIDEQPRVAELLERYATRKLG